MSDDTDKKAPQQRDLKVTDKRMFTPEGDLREEYRDIGEKSGEKSRGGAAAGRGPETGPGGPAVVDPGGSGESGAGAPSRTPGAPTPGAPPSGPGGPGSGPGGAPLDIPSSGPGPAPGFLDLVALLAEPVALYLGDAQTADGQSHENLDAARLHIDLLDVLREKTAGNLSAEESGILEDVLYRLRMRYVQKRG